MSRAPAGLTHLFPAPNILADADLSTFGIPHTRAASISALARVAVDDPGLFDRTQSLDNAIERLRALPGIGDWTAHYIALRALRETDAFPHSDLGLLRGFARAGVRPAPAELLARAETWRPWRARRSAFVGARREESEDGGQRFDFAIRTQKRGTAVNGWPLGLLRFEANSVETSDLGSLMLPGSVSRPVFAWSVAFTVR